MNEKRLKEEAKMRTTHTNAVEEWRGYDPVEMIFFPFITIEELDETKKKG